MIRMSTKPVDTVVAQVYFPTSGTDIDEIEEMYIGI